MRERLRDVGDPIQQTSDGQTSDGAQTPPAPRPGLLTQLAEDWQAHGRDWTRPGFQAIAVHRFGNWRMRVKPTILRAPLSILYRTLYRGVRNLYGIELPYSARVGRRVVIEHQSGIVIHGNSAIGDDCIIRQGVTLGIKNVTHPFDAPRLGKGVSVGAGAKILGRVSIGDGAQIGANAVVRSDVPAGSVAVGVPARVLDAVGQPRPDIPPRVLRENGRS